MTGTELARQELAGFLDVQTGELLPATVDNAARVLVAARGMDENVRALKAEVTAWLVAEAEHRGTKTLRAGEETVVLSGGTGTEYDAVELMELLRSAGCPEERVDAAVQTEITYKVDRSVLRQLRVNPDYAAAIDLAAHETEKPYRASVKLRRQTNDAE